MKFHRCKSVAFAVLLLAGALYGSQPLFAQGPDRAAVASQDHDTNDGPAKALLVASLAEYGEDQGDALALLSAAQVLNSMGDVAVARRDGVPDSVDMDSSGNDAHAVEELFTVKELTRQAVVFSESYDEGTRSAVTRIAEDLAERAMGKGSAQDKAALDFAHTHYVWWCGWSGCEYRWITHSHQ